MVWPAWGTDLMVQGMATTAGVLLAFWLGALGRRRNEREAVRALLSAALDEARWNAEALSEMRKDIEKTRTALNVFRTEALGSALSHPPTYIHAPRGLTGQLRLALSRLDETNSDLDRYRKAQWLAFEKAGSSVAGRLERAKEQVRSVLIPALERALKVSPTEKSV